MQACGSLWHPYAYTTPYVIGLMHRKVLTCLKTLQRLNLRAFFAEIKTRKVQGNYAPYYMSKLSPISGFCVEKCCLYTKPVHYFSTMHMKASQPPTYWWSLTAYFTILGDLGSQLKKSLGIRIILVYYGGLKQNECVGHLTLFRIRMPPLDKISIYRPT